MYNINTVNRDISLLKYFWIAWLVQKLNVRNLHVWALLMVMQYIQGRLSENCLQCSTKINFIA